jgi:hypothetical protein
MIKVYDKQKHIAATVCPEIFEELVKTAKKKNYPSWQESEQGYEKVNFPNTKRSYGRYTI